MKTIEDTLTEDLVNYWTDSPPAGLPAGWSIYDSKRTFLRVHPYVVIGDEGCPRERGQPDSGRVALRIMPVSDMDTPATDPETHRMVASALDDAIMAFGFNGASYRLQILDNTYIHDILRESPRKGLDGRREFTQLNYTAVVTRYAAQ